MTFLSKKFDISKLKTNLRLSINRLKLLEKKKTEISLKSRKEIADYIEQNKDDRARIKVEQIIREDYLVEAMEILEMFCDLLLARIGLIQTSKEIDPGLEESIATLIWVSPRLQSDVPEFKMIMNQLQLKYGKEFVDACLSNSMNSVSEKIMQKLSCNAPPKNLVEQYMIEIAKSYNIPFEPDPSCFEIPNIDDMIAICPPDPNIFNDCNASYTGSNSTGGSTGWGLQPPFGENYPPVGNYGQQQIYHAPSTHYGPIYPNDSCKSKPSFDAGGSGFGSQNELTPNEEYQPGDEAGASSHNATPYGAKSDNIKLNPAFNDDSLGSDAFIGDSSTFPPSYDQSENTRHQISDQSGIQPFATPPQLPSRPPAGPLPPVGGAMQSEPGTESMDLDDLVHRFEELKKKSC